MFQAKEAVRLALEGVSDFGGLRRLPPAARPAAPLPPASGGKYMVCPVCFNAKHLDKGSLLPNAELAGSVQLWEWIGDQPATTFSY